MSESERKDLYYVITNRDLNAWYLYSVEQCSFGKRLLWTSNLKSALIFSSEEAIESFMSHDLPNLGVSVYRFLRSKISTTE